MAKVSRTFFVCRECGASAPKWAGQCADCGAWNTLEETGPAPAAASTGGYAGAVSGAAVQSLGAVAASEQPRIATGIGELDRVLGGGLVEGAVVLIGGDPGIGKSTLLIQALARLATAMPTLYISGEESAQQIGLRARRLGLPMGDLRLLTETSVERIQALALAERPRVMVIDSIQTMYSEQMQSVPGAVAQVRETAAQLVRFAKRHGIAVLLVGHVTKEGSLAGPRLLEHMVDTVLYFEGEPGAQLRMVRAIKNRFGAVNELGVFAMTERGLREVSNPSAIFLSRHEDPVSGSSILVTWEGTRPLLVEVQALVDQSPLANPRRVALGLEQNRLSMLLAVLHRHAAVSVYDQDVFVNVVGGVRITETAADLPVLLAVLSSLRDRPLPRTLAGFGEVGLSGEVRPVPNGLVRVQEAVKHGFTRVIVPRANMPKKGVGGTEVIGINRLTDVLETLD